MGKESGFWVAVGFGLFLVLVVLGGVSFGADPNVTLEWKAGETQGQWSMITCSPNKDDRIVFAGPTKTYGNSCQGYLAIPVEPEIVIDSSQKLIKLIFPESTSGSCPAVYLPAYGYITAEVGPLEEDGLWRFETEYPWPENPILGIPCSYQTDFYVVPYSGGDGSAEDPWRISCKEDLLAMGDRVEDYNDCFVLTSDVNLVGEVFDSAVIAEDGNKFIGVFDGNEHKITNLAINSMQSYAGFFGQVGTEGKIKNLGLENGSVNGISYVGGLAGNNQGGAISNCSFVGTVSGTGGQIGGLVGGNKSSFVYGSIRSSYSKGKVTGSYNVGGLVGINRSFTSISKSYSGCDVRGISNNVGGLVGLNGEEGGISNCYSRGKVTGGFHVGGLVGTNYDRVTACYSASDVNGIDIVGGLIGYHHDGEVTSCFWDTEIQTYGVKKNVGLIGVGGLFSTVKGLSTHFMQMQNSYICSSSSIFLPPKTLFDVQDSCENDFHCLRWDFVDVWGIGEGQTYPYLRGGSASDVNQDGVVDYFDLAILAENWLLKD